MYISSFSYGIDFGTRVGSDVVIHHVTILAPQDSPNTDGIDPGFVLF